MYIEEDRDVQGEPTMEKTMEINVSTAYETNEVTTISGDSETVGKYIENIKRRFASVLVIELTEELLLKYPTAQDRWDADKFEEIKFV